MTAFGFTLVFAVGGQIKHLHPELLDEPDRAALIELATRALNKRLAFERAATDPADEPVIVRKVPSPTAADTMTQGEIARGQGYSGNVCQTCGEFRMKRTGTCETCEACGATSGGCS